MALLESVYSFGHQAQRLFWGNRSTFYKRAVVLENFLAAGLEAYAAAAYVKNDDNLLPDFILNMNNTEFGLFAALAFLGAGLLSTGIFGGIEHRMEWQCRDGEESRLLGGKVGSVN